MLLADLISQCVEYRVFTFSAPRRPLTISAPGKWWSLSQWSHLVPEAGHSVLLGVSSVPSGPTVRACFPGPLVVDL